jgi:hypothetical protein
VQNVSHDNFGQGQGDQQMAYANNGEAGAAGQQNGVTNITNIIYNFNLTPSQQLHKQQIE